MRIFPENMQTCEKGKETVADGGKFNIIYRKEGGEM